MTTQEIEHELVELDEATVTERSYSDAGNYYGTAMACISNGITYLAIKDGDGVLVANEVSREFYDAWVKEFGVSDMDG